MRMQYHLSHRALGRGAVVALAALALTAAAMVTLWAFAEPAHAHGGHAHSAAERLCVPLSAAPQLCSHGPDPAPRGVEAGQVPAARELQQRAETASYDGESPAYSASAVPSIDCLGDGTSGPRIQAIYARARDKADRFSTALPLIRQFAANADLYVNRSAAQRHSGRRLRFVTDRCKLKVLNVTLSAKGDDSFNDTVNELHAKGFKRNDRKYLVWVDATVLCGVGSMLPDDAPSPTNPNNMATGWARVDRTCWGGGVEAHELFHTFGAVQRSAKHSTPLGHCRDENDAMCYDDDYTGPVKMMSPKPCPLAGDWQIDCNHDDYFDPRPRSGSYLDTHWNTARSRFLEPIIAPPAEPVVSMPAPNMRLAGLKWGLDATSKAASGRTIDRWSWKVTDGWGHPTTLCKFSTPTKAATGFWCNATVAGSVLITVTVWDNKDLSNAAAKVVTLAKPATKRDTTLTLSTTPTPAPVGGGLVTITAVLTDTATAKPLIGMPIGIYGNSAYPLNPISLTYGPTNVYGRKVWTQTVAGTTTYYVDSYATPVWAASSKVRTVTVPLSPVTLTATAPATFDVPGYPAISGTASPVEPYDRTVILQSAETPAGPWTDEDSASTGNGGGFTFSGLYLDQEGLRYYRVRKTAAHYAAATSPIFSITGQKKVVTFSVPAVQTVTTWDPWTGPAVAFTTSTADYLPLFVQRCTGTCTSAGPWTTDSSSWVGGSAPNLTATLGSPPGLGTYSYRIVLEDDWVYADAVSDPFVVVYS